MTVATPDILFYELQETKKKIAEVLRLIGQLRRILGVMENSLNSMMGTIDASCSAWKLEGSITDKRVGRLK